jgi:predicted AAA+ superfamily ATPase
VGQVHEIEMFPLTFNEFASNFISNEMLGILREFSLTSEISEPFHQIFWKLFVDYLCVGGMHEVVATYKRLLEANPEQKSEALNTVEVKSLINLPLYLASIVPNL